MSTQTENNADVSIATLIGGIVQDARELFVEQMTLFQVEIKNDVRRTAMALIPIVIAVMMLMPGLIILGIGAAHFIYWLAPEMPLWAAFALTGASILVVAGILAYWGKTKLEATSITPDTALKGLKENIQWKTKN